LPSSAPPHTLSLSDLPACYSTTLSAYVWRKEKEWPTPTLTRI
jgi:hypothetical protein